MKREDEIRIRKFKLVRPRETKVDRRRKWMFDIDSMNIMMAVAILIIVAGILLIGYQLMHVIEKGKSLAGKATTTSASKHNIEIMTASAAKPIPIVRVNEVAYQGKIPVKGDVAHDGFDLDLAQGTKLEVTTPGTIVRSAYDSQGNLYGNYVDVKYNDGTYARFAHLDSLPSVNVGDSFGGSNQPLTLTTGQSGGESVGGVSAHLHYKEWTGSDTYDRNTASNDNVLTYFTDSSGQPLNYNYLPGNSNQYASISTYYDTSGSSLTGSVTGPVIASQPPAAPVVDATLNQIAAANAAQGGTTAPSTGSVPAITEPAPLSTVQWVSGKSPADAKAVQKADLVSYGFCNAKTKDCTQVFNDPLLSNIQPSAAAENGGHVILPALGTQQLSLDIGKRTESDLNSQLSQLDKGQVYVMGFGDSNVAKSVTNPDGLDISHMAYLKYDDDQGKWMVYQGHLYNSGQRSTSVDPFVDVLAGDSRKKVFIYDQSKVGKPVAQTQPVTVTPQPTPTPTPQPTPNPSAITPEQQIAIDDMNEKLSKLGIGKIATAANIEALKKGMDKAEATPYSLNVGDATTHVVTHVVSIGGKYYYLDINGNTHLVGDKDQTVTLRDTRDIEGGYQLNQEIQVVNGQKTGTPKNYISGEDEEGYPITLDLRQDQFDSLTKIDPKKDKVNVEESDKGTTVTVSRGSSELSSFTNSNDLKFDTTGKIQTGTITTTNYNYYDKYFDKDGNQITKAEWDKLKPEDRLTPKDNKNTFRSGLTKEENKDGTLYGEGKEEFLTVDKDGTQYRGELTSRVYNQKTTEKGVDYGQGDGINFVSDGQGNIMTFNCKFYTGCKFDSVTDINGVKTTDVNSITDPALKKFAQKQVQENSLANRRMFFSDVTRSMTQFSGVAGYSSLFFDSETLSAWRESVDSAFASMYLGTEYWSSKICASKIETGSDNLAYVETPDGLIGVAAHIEGEKVDITNPLNNTQMYIYKIDYFVQNHESSVVSTGFRKNDKKMKFNVEVRGSGGKKQIYDQDIQLATGEIKKISKDQMIVKESPHQYDKVCIVFKTPIRTIGSSFATESKDEICNKFSKYTGGPTEVATSSTSSGQGGAAEITSDW